MCLKKIDTIIFLKLNEEEKYVVINVYLSYIPYISLLKPFLRAIMMDTCIEEDKIIYISKTER